MPPAAAAAAAGRGGALHGPAQTHSFDSAQHDCPHRLPDEFARYAWYDHGQTALAHRPVKAIGSLFLILFEGTCTNPGCVSGLNNVGCKRQRGTHSTWVYVGGQTDSEAEHADKNDFELARFIDTRTLDDQRLLQSRTPA